MAFKGVLLKGVLPTHTPQEQARTGKISNAEDKGIEEAPPPPGTGEPRTKGDLGPLGGLPAAQLQSCCGLKCALNQMR